MRIIVSDIYRSSCGDCDDTPYSVFLPVQVLKGDNII